MSLFLDALLALLAIITALRAVAGRDGFAQVVAFMAYGLVLGLIWVRLAAVDVALTEVAVGSGITGLVLLRAAARVGNTPMAPAVPVRRLFHKLLAGLVALVVFAGLAAVVVLLPEPAPSLAPQVAEALPATDLGNPITGVLIVFRALDTLLETVVLLLALIGVWALSPDRVWAGRPAVLLPAPWSGALDVLARVMVPAGVMVGLYLFWAGADVPGGAFQGGAVLAAMALMALAAGLVPRPLLRSRRLRLLLLAGPFAFLLVGLLGWAVAGAFLAYPPGIEKPVIILVEAAITLSIAVTLALLVLGPPQPEEAE